MRKMILFGLFLACLGLTGWAGAQTAAQYTAAGNQSYAAKDFAKAVQYYQAAANMDPNSAAAFQGLGNSQYSLGQNNEAIASYEKALNLNPNNTALSSFVQSLKAKVAAAPSVSVPAPEKSSPAAGGSAKKFELDLMAGVAMGAGGYDLGFGGGVGGYMLMDGGLAMGGSVGYYTFSKSTTTPLFIFGNEVSNQSSSDIEILGSVKYSFEGSGFKPYLKGGAGIAMIGNSSSMTVNLNPPYNVPPYTTFYTGGSVPGSSSLFPMVQVGGGAQFSMGPDMSLFGEAKYSLVISGSGTASYIPINVGLALNI